MPLLAFGLVVFSAMLHASWNFTTKKADGNFAVVFNGLVLFCVLFFPVFLFSASEVGRHPEALPYIFITGLAHAAYFYLLSKAYQHGDISSVYPIARGTGIAGTTLVAVLLLGEAPSPVGILGIAAILGGIILISGARNPHPSHVLSLAYALAVGASIVCYSIADKQAVGFLSPVAYIFLMFGGTVLFQLPLILVSYRKEVGLAWKEHKRSSLIIGVGSGLTYLTILFVYQIAPVSYVVALREVAVVFGAGLGIKLLHERVTAGKLLGVLAIVVGMVLIKLA